MRIFSIISLLFAFFIAPAHAENEEVVDFHIIHGTAKSAWNTADTMVQTKVGQILRIYNDDEIVHRLHTNGAPCDHGSDIKPGTSWDCKIVKEYNEKANGRLYDHYVGTSAQFFLVSEKKAE